MQLTFLGTKGYIDFSTKCHFKHTATLISYKKTKILIDCGEEWKKLIQKFSFDYVLLTHAHPDHAYGLSEKIKKPVFATQETWKNLEKIHVLDKRIIFLRKKIKLGSIKIEAFPVIHSIFCPAVGYKIEAGKTKIFYVPDVLWIEDMEKAFKGIKIYIGDGATLYHNMARRSKKTGQLFGHATIRQQLTWCQKFGVKKMIITHCGTDIVKNEQKAKKTLKILSVEKNVKIIIARDRMELTV